MKKISLAFLDLIHLWPLVKEFHTLNVTKSICDCFSSAGTGTFGRVVLGRDRKTKEYRALKILNITDVIKLKQTEHVLNEKSILLAVNHPFIVRL